MGFEQSQVGGGDVEELFVDDAVSGMAASPGGLAGDFGLEQRVGQAELGDDPGHRRRPRGVRTDPKPVLERIPIQVDDFALGRLGVPVVSVEPESGT